MKEITEDIFYEYIKKYDKLLLDYAVISADDEYNSEISHKEAVITAISAFNQRKRVGNRFNPPEFYVNESKMSCKKCSTENFFTVNPVEKYGNCMFVEESCYWNYSDAFLYYTPYRVPYTEKDFQKVNYVLFPECYRKDLEIYIWNDNFSNYFDDGNDCMGAVMWSVYDKHMKRFIIIGSSMTD